MEISIWYHPKRTFLESKLLSFWGKNFKETTHCKLSFFSISHWYHVPQLTVVTIIWCIRRRGLITYSSRIGCVEKATPSRREVDSPGEGRIRLQKWWCKWEFQCLSCTKNTSRRLVRLSLNSSFFLSTKLRRPCQFHGIQWPQLAIINDTHSSPSSISCDRNRTRLRGLNIC